MSKDIKSRKWTLKSHFSGLPKREDLEIVEEQVPQLKDGGRYGMMPQVLRNRYSTAGNILFG